MMLRLPISEEGQEEARSGKRDRDPEDDLDQTPEAAACVAEGERQPGNDDDDDGDDLRDRPLDRIEDLLKRLLPGHVGAGGMGGPGETDAEDKPEESGSKMADGDSTHRLLLDQSA